jgi:hypothetical protein
MKQLVPMGAALSLLMPPASLPMLAASLLVLAASIVMLAAPAAKAQQHATVSDAELLGALKGAGPQDLVDHATILKMGADGQMSPIRTGDNGWTCMLGPGATPMCADMGAMEWAKAFKAKGPAPQKLGFIYMLAGDNGASNTDPYATQETSDNNWVKTGPHVMIVGAEAKRMMQAYPRSAKADPSKPYVMWPDTPYEHLMLPLK